MADLDDPELDLALRYCHPDQAPRGAVRMFGETLTPVAGAGLMEQAHKGLMPPLQQPADLARHTLLEEDDSRPSAEFLSWRYWLRQQGLPQLQPLRWLFLNYTYQQIQAALSGQGIALARVALVYEPLARGELVEPFGPQRRLHSPFSYWALRGGSADRPELQQFFDWIVHQAALTRAAIGEP
jgi:LysR family glycine cleavage system transcriptional activator